MFIDGSNANSGFTDHKCVGTVNSWASVSTVTLQSISPTSKRFVFLKSSTKNPVLNLVNPSASWICKVFVSSSSKVNDEVTSKFSILSSNLPISLMVNLTLSTKVIIASSGS